MPFLPILLFIIIICLTIWGRWYNSPKQKGKRGEKRVYETLLSLSDDYHIFNDVVLASENGTTQIDHIVVSKYGIFPIEVKNYRGDIYGNDNRQKWTQIIATEVTYKNSFKTYTYVTKNHFYSPVMQSYGHVREIKNKLSKWPHIKIVPIIVFTGNANLSNIESKTHVIYNSDLITTILNYKTICLSESDVWDVINCLSKRNIRDIVDDKTHVRNINEKIQRYNNNITKGKCPKCGGTLVKRNGQYGSFYGCSNYPNCNFTTN